MEYLNRIADKALALRLEADAVLHLDDGRYALIECKLGSREI